MQLKTWGDFLGNPAREIRRDIQRVAVSVCVMMHADPWPARILGFIAVMLLLPNTIVFAPRVLARCPSLRRLRGK